MRAVPRWRDDHGVVHDVEEWLSWGFMLFEDPESDSLDLDGHKVWETACGVRLTQSDVTIAFSGEEPVTCLECLSQCS